MMFAVSPLYEAKQVFLIIMTMTTIILAAIAYAKLKEISGDVIDIVNNWKLVPFTEVYVAESGDCDADFEEFGYKYGKFEGLERGHCGCVSNGLYSSTYTNCSEDASASGYCMTSNSRPDIGASTWRHNKICFKRSGQSAASWTDGYTRRPYVDSSGACPSGYKKCGKGTNYENDKAICFPETELCPITGVTVEPNGDTPSGTGWVEANGSFTRSGYTLWYRREEIGELPLAQLSLTLTDYASNNVGPDYDYTQNDRGPCYTGRPQDIKAQVKVSDTTLAEHSLSSPSKCNRVDRRYRLFDKLRLDSFYLDQFEKNSHCSGYMLYTTDDPSFDSSTDADYLLSNNKCSGSECDRDTSFPTNCLGGDDICDLVVNQNICGQYVAAVRDLKSNSNSMGVYYRSEIQWNPDCNVDQDSLRDNVDPLIRALDAQLAVVVISSILGVLVGIIWPVYMLVCGKQRFYGKPNEITIPERFDSILHVMKLGPLIASVVVLSDIYRLYENAGKDDCSDDLTNESFDYLAERLPEIFKTNIANICIECVMMIAGIYFLSQKMKNQMKVDIEPTTEDDNGSPAEKPTTIPTVSVPTQPAPNAPLQYQPVQQYQHMQQPSTYQQHPQAQFIAQSQPGQSYQNQPGQPMMFPQGAFQPMQQQPMQYQMQQPMQYQMQQPMQQQPVQFQMQQQPMQNQFQQQPMQYQMHPMAQQGGINPGMQIPTVSPGLS